MSSKRAAVLRCGLVIASIAAAAAAVAGCRPAPERLQLQGRTLTVFNDSGEEWRDVEVWVNDHYRVTRQVIAPGERFAIPLEAFVAGFGQRFPARQQVTGIEVTATDGDGEPVRITWGEGRRR